jgi:hypothetical protein
MSEEFNLQLFAHEKAHVLQFGCIDESATAHRHAQKYRLQSVTDSDAGFTATEHRQLKNRR